MTHATLSNKINMDISDIIVLFAKVICINGFKNILVPLKTLRRAIWGPGPPSEFGGSEKWNGIKIDNLSLSAPLQIWKPNYSCV